MRNLGALFLVCLAMFSAPVTGEEEVTKKDRDREAILAMAGTFVVDFHFEETVPFEQGYEPKEAYNEAALEEVIVEEDSENKIVLQHLLQTESGRIIKHWRQDWEFENKTLWEFQGDNRWTKRELSPQEAKGTWTQRVFQVDDSPRYESFGEWKHIGNLSEWRSHVTNRPLPRREHTKRDDYNILVGVNTHALTQTGWVHEQDNTKLDRSEKGDKVLVREFGLNRYDRTLESRCVEAREWWSEHGMFWADVRHKWDDVFASRKELVLRDAVEEGPLYKHLNPISKRAGEAEKYDSAVYSAEAGEWIDKFIVDPAEETQVGQAAP